MGMAMNSTYPGVYGAAPPLSQVPYPGGVKPIVPEAEAPPNSILFVQNLPHETTPVMLHGIFSRYIGLKEVRMVEAKPGIAFVEYTDEMQSTVAMQGLQGVRLSKTKCSSPMPRNRRFVLSAINVTCSMVYCDLQQGIVSTKAIISVNSLDVLLGGCLLILP